MTNGEAIAYNIASFICALFVLEFGADKFIDHTAAVARRTGIPPAVIGLLTAGAEWEELAVVAISIARHRPSLAAGNIVGSTISNILGAFSLGLLFHARGDRIVFDKSSKVYCALLLGLTVFIAGLEGFGNHLLGRVVGGVLIALFVVYIISIAWTIRRGLLSGPELSDSDDDSESGSDSSSNGNDSEGSSPGNGSIERAVGRVQRRVAIPDQLTQREATSAPHSASTEHQPPTTIGLQRSESTTSTQGLVSSGPARSSQRGNPSAHRSNHAPKHSLQYHIALLTLGFLAVILSAYVLSTAATNLVDEFDMSDVLFGVVILSIATTLPEKFVAVISGSRGHAGIMVANTVGSNIFLLSLVIGVLWVSTGGVYDQGSTNPIELGVMVGSTVVMTLTVWLDLPWTRWIGAAMLLAYIVFLALEFTLIRPV